MKHEITKIFNKIPIHISQFAVFIGINPSLLRQYTSGIKTPSEKQLKRIEKGLNDLGEVLTTIKLK